MPIYEYRCIACGRHVEVMHAIHEQGPGACGTCGGAMRKALSAPAILFKGSGWAKKDARSAARPASETSPSGGAREAGAGDAGAADSSAGATAGTSPTGAGEAAAAATGAD